VYGDVRSTRRRMASVIGPRILLASIGDVPRRDASPAPVCRQSLRRPTSSGQPVRGAETLTQIVENSQCANPPKRLGPTTVVELMTTGSCNTGRFTWQGESSTKLPGWRKTRRSDGSTSFPGAWNTAAPDAGNRLKESQSHSGHDAPACGMTHFTLLKQLKVSIQGLDAQIMSSGVEVSKQLECCQMMGGCNQDRGKCIMPSADASRFRQPDDSSVTLSRWLDPTVRVRPITSCRILPGVETSVKGFSCRLNRPVLHTARTNQLTIVCARNLCGGVAHGNPLRLEAAIRSAEHSCQ